MQIATEDRKNITNERLLKSTNESAPKIWAKVALPVAVGGVSGRVKEKSPSTTADTIAIWKIITLSPTFMKPTMLVTTIQATVPITRIAGKSCSGLFIWRIAMELVNEIQGANDRQ